MMRIALPALLLFALLCACTRRPMPPDGSDDRQGIAARWEQFKTTTDTEKPYRLRMSLRFGSEGDTRRVTGLLWGNNTKKMRLDIMAGVGVVTAKILEDGEHFLVFVPGEHKAYFYQGEAKPLLKVGVPLPFSLANLSDLLNGRSAAVFGTEFAAASALPNGLGQYELPGKPGGRLLLNAEGLPLTWKETAHDSGWRMEIAYDEDGPKLPHRLTLTHGKGKRAILLVKEREAPDPFSEAQMRLELPQNIPLLPLAKFKPR